MAAGSGAAEADPAGSSFTVLHDQALSQEVVMGCWCPTMDLLALLMDDGQLVLFRLEWQRLWLACPGVPVTALCWRPDGGLRWGGGGAGITRGAAGRRAAARCFWVCTRRGGGEACARLPVPAHPLFPAPPRCGAVKQSWAPA